MAGIYPRTGRLAERRPAAPAPGHKYGKWSFEALDTASRYWVVCECGSRRSVRSQDLRQGKSQSCGCAAGRPNTCGAEKRTKHGVDYGSKLYRAWRNAKNRVSNPKAKKYATYGAAGITMDPEWFSSFPAFASGVGEPPSPAHSLDRVDGRLGYVPGNVRWATASEQSRNRANTLRATLGGVTKPLIDWCEERGLNYRNAAYRLRKGAPVEEILGEPK